jgi:hypothetical protein
MGKHEPEQRSDAQSSSRVQAVPTPASPVHEAPPSEAEHSPYQHVGTAVQDSPGRGSRVHVPPRHIEPHQQSRSSEQVRPSASRKPQTSPLGDDAQARSTSQSAVLTHGPP